MSAEPEPEAEDDTVSPFTGDLTPELAADSAWCAAHAPEVGTADVGPGGAGGRVTRSTLAPSPQRLSRALVSPPRAAPHAHAPLRRCAR